MRCMHQRLRTALILCALPCWVHAVQVCELDGQPVNPSNGHTTAGKTGLMRCRDADSSRLVREQELRNGVFMGLVRHYRGGILQQEYQVNERGNRDGVSREFAATAADPNPLLMEETLRNGSTVGAARRWHPNGQLKRVSFHGEDGREQAVAAFTPQGRLSELRCAPRAVLAPHIDDAKLCGHQGGKPETVALHDDDGSVRARLTLERGERRVYELLWDNGGLRERKESGDAGGSERSFSIDGIKRRELQWVALADGTRTQRITTLDQEFHDSGKLVRERRWRATARGGELQTEQTWYLNGQPRDKLEHLGTDNAPARRDTHFHDNGQVASVGLWLVKGRYDTQASGVHQQFDDTGRLRRERHHDNRGRVSREREFDEAGAVTRDDEVFEDGSRKGLSR
jgi:antitoxin component YwqK of YwqJK toxin-antitoxin module